MPPQGYFIDAQLLVLFVAGSVNRSIIARHRRLQDYTVADYELLLALLNTVNRLLVTPNTLTQASDLLAQHAEPERSRLLEQLRTLITDGSEEQVVASVDAVAGAAFLRHGLTDAALLVTASEQTPVLTVDGPLFQEALAGGREIAVDFGALRRR